MSQAFRNFLSTVNNPIPQSAPADPRQVENNAGGYTFTVTDQARLERFLILGTDGGTYYVQEQDLTRQNVEFLKELVERNEELVWDTVRDISVNGRAYRNSPAILAAAYLARYGKIKDTPQGRPEKTAKNLVYQVCRTATHLYEWTQYMKLLGGWGRARRNTVAGWYTNKTPDQLAYQAVKYRQRNGWTHRDLLRLAHPRDINQNVGNFILGKEVSDPKAPAILTGFQHAQEATSVDQVINVLATYPNLPWEAIPTQFLREPNLWKKLFYNDQLNGQALIRNITRLARIHAFDDMVFAHDFAAKLADKDMIAKTRLHPIQFLLALSVHETGQIDRTGRYSLRKKDWQIAPMIVDALNSGFYQAFNTMEPANKRTLVAVDVSGSMGMEASGIELTHAQCAAAVAMAVVRREPYYSIMGFDHNFRDLGITPNMGLAEVLRRTRCQTFGNTDCSLPMTHAMRFNLEIDTFVVITDNETWYGGVHPHIALNQYRQQSGIPARLVVLGTAATPFTIADPRDSGMLDCVGFDANVSRIVADFSRGDF